MTQYVAKNRQDNNSGKIIYDLYGISNHYGNLEGGHYTAFCEN
jgi:ubiquitin C-terminal hydrolase